MTISKAVREIVSKDYVLSFGLQNRILNLTQVARFLQKSVEKQCNDSVSIDAIVMALSRLQQDYVEFAVPSRLKIDEFSVKKDLALVSLLKTKRNLQMILKLKLYALQNDLFYSVAESMNEISLVIDKSLVCMFESYDFDMVNFIQKNVSAYIIKIPKDYLEIPGVFQYFVQRFTLNQINILEVSSTYTELIFYIDSNDLSLVIDLF